METLRYGSTGPIVEFLQNILNKLGFYSGDIDGVFGTSTKDAVIEFQNSNNLTPDGIVGTNTWKQLSPYINGALGFIVPTNISYSYSILEINLNTLQNFFPFLEVTSSGKSVLGNDIPVIKIGTGSKQVFYSASIHANEWITSPLLMRFLESYCYCYANDLPFNGMDPKQLYETATIYIMPMVNPDRCKSCYWRNFKKFIFV